MVTRAAHKHGGRHYVELAFGIVKGGRRYFGRARHGERRHAKPFGQPRRVDVQNGESVNKREFPALETLLEAVRACRACEAHLPLGPRPVLRAAAAARILIVGQAPGLRVHNTGIPWDDPSGERLRGVDGNRQGSLLRRIPHRDHSDGLLLSGPGQGGDLPPRRECAQLWLDQLLAAAAADRADIAHRPTRAAPFSGRRRKRSLAATIDAWASTPRDTFRCLIPRRATRPGFSATPGSASGPRRS